MKTSVLFTTTTAVAECKTDTGMETHWLLADDEDQSIELSLSRFDSGDLSSHHDDESDQENPVVVVVDDASSLHKNNAEWCIGLCAPSSNVVEWSVFTSETEARVEFAAWEGLRSDSAVLFHWTSHTWVPCRFLSLYPLDVAAILYAARQSPHRRRRRQQLSRVDRRRVWQATQDGSVPMIGVTRSKMEQFLVKQSMDLFFRRETIQCFAAAPHRFTSLCCYDVQTYPQVRGTVALSLDDAPCRLGYESSYVERIRLLLREHQARATFMVAGGFVRRDARHVADLAALVRDGHELGNHGMLDQAYDTVGSHEFARTVDDCNAILRHVYEQAGKPRENQSFFFRAPHGKYTETMERVLSERGMQNVMCDVYASCPVIEDGSYIAQSLARQAQDGSILLLHMPERGFREWCWPALQELLQALQQRQFKIVTVGELGQLANGPVPQHQEQQQQPAIPTWTTTTALVENAV